MRRVRTHGVEGERGRRGRRRRRACVQAGAAVRGADDHVARRAAQRHVRALTEVLVLARHCR